MQTSQKYHAVPTTIDGLRFASKAEARHYGVLKALLRTGAITGLELQVRYPLHVNGVLICTYKADFVYRDSAGELVVVDVKGVLTPVYRLKRKLMKAIYGISILEVGT